MKVVVLGDGLLGSEIIKQTNWPYVSRKKDSFDLKTSSLNFDRFDIIVNCIANTNTYSENKQEHWDINYKSVIRLADYCTSNHKKLVHISTDYIYTNSESGASENSIPVHGNNWYSYTKLLGDAYVQLDDNNLIIRTSHKPYPFPYPKAWNNQYTNGDYVNVIAQLIVLLIQNNEKGVYNVGTSIKTWYSLTKGEFNTEAISKPQNAPEDITMDISKLENFLNKYNDKSHN